MSGVLHPIGPEPERVYWVRRVLVAAAAVILVVLLVAIVSNLGNAAQAGGPEAVPAPAGTTSAPAADPPIGTSTSASPRTSVSSSASESSTASAARSSSADRSAAGRSSSADRSAGKPSASASTSASSSSAPSAEPVAWCAPTQLRQTLTGPQNIKAKARTEFKLSLINGSGQACRVKVDASRFVLTVYSGTDRIWSSADCPSQIKGATVKLADEDAYEWRQVWNGLRSIRPCQARPEVPRPGTYWATASYTGTEPVRFRMILS